MPQEHAFDVARTQLVLGTIQRRKKMKRLARDTLGLARPRCSELGAELWALRCDIELDRIGGRAPSAIDLTPTERQIASLVAKGVTNREIATALFMSVKTVESNLSRIYRKVGVRSRTELDHRLAEDRRPSGYSSHGSGSRAFGLDDSGSADGSARSCGTCRVPAPQPST